MTNIDENQDPTQDIISRPNDMTGENLLEEDFQLEQQNIKERQGLTRLLHVSGVVHGFEILEVKIDPNTEAGDSRKITAIVSAGCAIDSLGRQIIKTSDRPVQIDLPVPMDFSDDKSLELYLYVGYKEMPVDRAIGELSITREKEETVFELIQEKGVKPDYVLLSLLTIEEGKIKSDSAFREYSGVARHVREIHLRDAAEVVGEERNDERIIGFIQAANDTKGQLKKEGEDRLRIDW